MAPVWEVNNVWLVFVLVIMWTGFPVLFQRLFQSMWLPLALAAVGIVLRGAGFALRKPAQRQAGRRLYGTVFAVSSLVTPFFLGVTAGGVASGRVTADADPSTHAWAHPTPVLFGLLAVATTALLGAVFLAADARRFDAPDLAGYFRRRALAALGCVAVLAVSTLAVTRDDAPHVWHGLTHGAGLGFVVAAAVGTLATGLLLARGATDAWSRVAAVVVVASAVIAWGMAQRPYLVPTTLTVSEGAARTPRCAGSAWSPSSPWCWSCPPWRSSTGSTPVASWRASPTPTCAAAAPATRAEARKRHPGRRACAATAGRGERGSQCRGRAGGRAACAGARYG